MVGEWIETSVDGRATPQHGINIEELQTDTYPAPHTVAPMFSVAITVGLPADAHVPNLRADFFDYCDELNLDATFEPARA